MKNILVSVVFIVFVMGCQTETSNTEERPVGKCHRIRRQRTEGQLDILRTFALQESPSLWQTVQMLQAEGVSRKAGLENLRNDLLDFGRDPDADKEYQILKKACEDIDDSLEVVYCRIEDAYIAYKKYQATPGKNEYCDIMQRALEEGINEAESASQRYRNMTINK